MTKSKTDQKQIKQITINYKDGTTREAIPEAGKHHVIVAEAFNVEDNAFRVKVEVAASQGAVLTLVDALIRSYCENTGQTYIEIAMGLARLNAGRKKAND